MPPVTSRPGQLQQRHKLGMRLSRKACRLNLAGAQLGLPGVQVQADGQDRLNDLKTKLEMLLVDADALHGGLSQDEIATYPKRHDQLFHNRSHLAARTGGRRKMCTYTLVNAVSACLRMRDSEALQQTAINIVRMLVPDLAEDILHRVKSLPSKASLSRSRPVVDVGLMLWQKHLNMHLDLAMSHGQEDGFLCRCLLTDSSPQRKFDWLLTEYHTFSGKRFLQLLALAWDMACLRETAAAAGTELEASPQWCQLQADVEGMLQEKVLEEPWSGYLMVEHCRDTLRLGTAKIFSGWALQGYFAVGHCRDT